MRSWILSNWTWLTTGPSNIRLGLSYATFTALPGVNDTVKASQVSATLNLGLTRYWSLALTDTRDIGGATFGTTTVPSGATINSGVALTYRDECMTVSTSITQSGISVGDVKPGVSFLLTIVFKNLGEVGGRTSTGS